MTNAVDVNMRTEPYDFQNRLTSTNTTSCIVYTERKRASNRPLDVAEIEDGGSLDNIFCLSK